MPNEAQKGPLLILSRAGSALVGIRTKSISIQNDRLDTTTDDDITLDGQSFRTFIPGITGFEISGTGVPKDGAADKALVAAFNAGDPEAWTIEWTARGTWSGDFFLQELSISGDAEGLVEYSGITILNSGPITWTPAS